MRTMFKQIFTVSGPATARKKSIEYEKNMSKFFFYYSQDFLIQINLNVLLTICDSLFINSQSLKILKQNLLQ